MELDYIFKASIQALSLYSVINLTGFICSLENVNRPNITRKDDESLFEQTALNRIINHISKPGRNLAYIISKKY